MENKIYDFEKKKEEVMSKILIEVLDGKEILESKVLKTEEDFENFLLDYKGDYTEEEKRII